MYVKVCVCVRRSEGSQNKLFRSMSLKLIGHKGNLRLLLVLNILYVTSFFLLIWVVGTNVWHEGSQMQPWQAGTWNRGGWERIVLSNLQCLRSRESGCLARAAWWGYYPCTAPPWVYLDLWWHRQMPEGHRGMQVIARKNWGTSHGASRTYHSG